MRISASARRGAVVLAAGATAVLGFAAPASAHVEVTATPPQALAAGAVLTLNGAAESDTAGVTGVRVQLPAGLLPADFRLTGAPTGWRMTGAEQVLTVSGPALPVGRDLRLTLRVRQLPATDRLVLKTVQTYSDGSEDAWIELPSASVPEPDEPAPVVALRAAAPGATVLPRAVPTTAAPTTPAPTTAAPTTAAPTTAAASSSAPSGDGSAEGAGSAAWLFGGVGVGVLLLGGFVLALRRRADAENARR